MKSDHPKTARSAAAAPAANDAAAKKMTQSDFKNNINQAFKVNNNKKSKQEIIETKRFKNL